MIALDSIQTVDSSEWNSISNPENPAQDHSFLMAVENANFENAQHRHFVYRENNGTLLAHFTAYFVTIPIEAVILGKAGILPKIFNKIRRWFPNFFTFRLVEAGALASLGHTFAFHQSISSEKKDQIMFEFFQELARWGSEKKALAVSARGFRNSELEGFKKAQELGFEIFHALSDTILDIKWETFEEYLGSLKAKYRWNYREVEAAEKAGLRREVITDYASYASQITDLWTQIDRRSKENSLETFTPEYFRDLTHFLKENTFACLYYIKDRLAGFQVLLQNKTILFCYCCGVDDVARSQVSIIRTIYFDAIRFAIERKKLTLHLGATTYPMKRSCGCQVEPLFMLARFKYSLFAKFFRLTTRQWARDASSIHKSVFKS